MKILVLLYLILFTMNGFSQKSIREFPLNVSIGSHSFNLPFRQLLRHSPYYPSVLTGTEFAYHKTKFSKLFQSVNMGFFHNSSTGAGAFIESQLGYRYTSKFGLFADLSLGAGYLHRFHPRTIYKMNSANEYVKVTDTGKPSFMAGFTNGIGYDLSKKTNIPLSIFARYQWFFQTPHFKRVLPGFHSITLIGISIKDIRILFKNRKL